MAYQNLSFWRVSLYERLKTEKGLFSRPNDRERGSALACERGAETLRARNYAPHVNSQRCEECACGYWHVFGARVPRARDPTPDRIDGRCQFRTRLILGTRYIHTGCALNHLASEMLAFSAEHEFRQVEGVVDVCCTCKTVVLSCESCVLIRTPCRCRRNDGLANLLCNQRLH